MLKIEGVVKQDRLLRALTGLNKKAFETLLPIFQQQYEQSLKSKSRKRAVGGGRKAQLKTITAKLFFILFYFKCYLTFDLAGFIFGIHRSQAHYCVHKLQPIVKKAFIAKMVLPDKSNE